MSDTQPMQASGQDDDAGTGTGDATGERPAAGGGESAGGAYPNPHTGHGHDAGGWTGHGGQSEIAYHGTGQGGTDDDPEVGNPNAVAKGD
jgi:hypothetical protein